MKIQVVVTFILIALSVTYVAAGKSPVRQCANPFTPSLRLHGAKVFDLPRHGKFDHCQVEWNEHGSCCEATSLVKMFNEDQDSIKKSSVKLEAIVANIKNLLDDIAQKGQDVLKKENSDLTSEEKVLVKRINGIIDLAKHKFFETFQSTSSECWDYMAKLRGSALCSICSGRSRDFFIDGKAAIDEKTCTETIGKCTGFFSNYNTFISSFTGIVKELISDSTSTNDQSNLEKLHKVLINNSPPSELMRLFKEYRELPKSSTDRVNMVASGICSHIMQIRHAPIVVSVAIIMKIEKFSEFCKAGLGNMVQKTKELMANRAKKIKEKLANTGKALKRGVTAISNWITRSDKKCSGDRVLHWLKKQEDLKSDTIVVFSSSGSGTIMYSSSSIASTVTSVNEFEPTTVNVSVTTLTFTVSFP